MNFKFVVDYKGKHLKYIGDEDLIKDIPNISSDISYMFSYYKGMSLVLENIDLSWVQKAEYLFEDVGVPVIVLRNIDLSGIVSLRGMFSNCLELREVKFENVKLGCITDVSCMFENCSNLKEVNLSNLQLNNVINARRMFANCTELKKITLGDNFNFSTEHYGTMASMFQSSGVEEVDLYRLNTSYVMDFANIFAGCYNIKFLDLSTFDFSNAIHLNSMFLNCEELREVKLSKMKITSSDLHKSFTLVDSLRILHFEEIELRDVDRFISFLQGLQCKDIRGSFKLPYLLKGINLRFYISEIV